MNDGFIIQDENDGGQNVPSLKEIALIHIRKISGICCGEFSKGYWEERPVKVGGGIAIMKHYNPDQRAAFCNAVDFLLWLVLPFGDDRFKEKYSDRKEEGKEDKDKWEEKLAERKEIFKEINKMFARTNFFDSLSGKTE